MQHLEENEDSEVLLDSLDQWLPGRRPRVREQLLRGNVRELCTSSEGGEEEEERIQEGCPQM